MNVSENTFTEQAVLANSILMVFGLFGFILYLLCVVVVVREKLYQSPYYAFLVALGNTELTQLFICVFYSSPIFIFQYDFGLTINVFVGVIVNTNWFSGVIYVGLLAINRTICLRSNAVMGHVTTKTTWMLIVGACAIGFAGDAPSFAKCCYFLSVLHDYRWSWEDKSFDIFVAYELTLCGTIGVVVIICFVLSFAQIYQWKREGQRGTTEDSAGNKLFAQVFLTTMNLVLFELFFQIVPMFKTGKWIGFISTVLYINTCCNNGFVYLAMDRNIRKGLKKLLRIESNVVAPITVAWSITNTPQNPELRF